MAEDKSGAKNEAGKLFVDIGIGGIGKALKSLNSVSASFLLGKNAAMQFAQTISQPFKEAGKGAIEIGKMSNALATSGIEFQKLALYLKNFNLSDALLGDVSKLEQTFYDLSQGFTNLEGSMAVGLAQAGLNAKDYKGTFQDTMRMLDDLQKATANMSLEKRNQILRQIGISQDWGYLWDKGGRASDYLTISDDQIAKLQSMQEAMNKARETLETIKDKFLAEMAPKITVIADSVTAIAQKFVTGGGIQKTANATTSAVGAMIPKNAGEAASLVLPGVAVSKGVKGAIQGWKNSKGGATGGAASISTELTENTTTGQAAPIFSSDITEGASIPPSASGVVQNITNNINHDITINGDNPEAIANKIGSLSEQDIQYTQYQANNMAGI